MTEQSRIEKVTDHKVARAELLKRVLIFATFVSVSIVLVLLVVLIGQIRATQQTGSPVLKAIIAQQEDIIRGSDAAVETNEAVLDCLDPTGECYKRSQENQAGILVTVNEIAQYAAVCADRPGSQTLEAIKLCMADLITAAQRSETPSVE